MIKLCLGNARINSIPEKRVFLHNFSLRNKNAKAYLACVASVSVEQRAKNRVFGDLLPNRTETIARHAKAYRTTSASSYNIHSFTARNWRYFRPWKPHLFHSLGQSMKLHRRAVVLTPCLIPCNRCEKSAGEPRNSFHLITQRDDTHARIMFVDPHRYIMSLIGERGSKDLRSPSPIMAPAGTYFGSLVD